jgi:aspartate racemase
VKKKIGIIGGAGPMASCQLYKMIIKECQAKYGCKEDVDFPEMIIINYPFAKMINAEFISKNKEKLVQQLQKCFDEIDSCGGEVVGIACNTLHTLLEDIEFSRKNFIHIVDAVFYNAEQNNVEKILILATSTTVKSKLYASDGFLESVYPDKQEQKLVDQIITNVLEDKVDSKDSKTLSDLISNYDVDGVVLGCTEIPVLHEEFPINFDGLALNTTKILAENLVKKSMIKN